jgi:hypothetical protein
VKDGPRSRQPKPQGSDENVDRIRAIRLGVRLITEEGCGIFSEEKTRTLVWQVDSLQ